jgi:hypothetical protein
MLSFAIGRSQVFIPRGKRRERRERRQINSLFHLYGSDLRKSAFICGSSDSVLSRLGTRRLGQTVPVQCNRADNNQALDDILPDVGYAGKDQPIG